MPIAIRWKCFKPETVTVSQFHPAENVEQHFVEKKPKKIYYII
jgi:hypothetical protein